MLVFVDESGDTGLKLGKGSSARFTLALVLFEDHEEAGRVEERITNLRRELRKPANFEFHFRENSDDIRDAFFQAVAPFGFSYFAFVIDKAGFYSVNSSNQNAAYADICGLVFEAARSLLRNALVKIDRSGGHDFRRELAAYLKRKVNDPTSSVRHIKRVDMPTSQANDLLQLADMVCGAVARSYHEGKKEPYRFRKIIAHREVSVRYLPEQKSDPPPIGKAERSHPYNALFGYREATIRRTDHFRCDYTTDCRPCEPTLYAGLSLVLRRLAAERDD